MKTTDLATELRNLHRQYERSTIDEYQLALAIAERTDAERWLEMVSREWCQD